ncbi:MAG: HAD family hydrolase [Proteobacteria bacterium]|nr:HAD family hydrolase [Pseudomonadota bacterium]
MANKAVFLDRDGTIMHDHGYIKDPQKVDILPGVSEAVDILIDNGFMLFIVTNQSGIGRGIMTMADVNKVNDKMLSYIGRNKIKEILICPHGPDESCSCRKPGLKLVEAAEKKYKLDLKYSYSIGDKDCDRQLGENFGGTGIKIGEKGIKNLLNAAIFIIEKENSNKK